MPVTRFDNEKEQAMLKFASIDKSKKGSVDRRAVPLIKILNSHPDHYTTSSCSGRILVLNVTSSRRKDLASWPYVTHSIADPKELIAAARAESSGNLWLRQEAVILHVACRDISCAENLLSIVRQAGFKRAGIISAGKRAVIEIIGTDAVAIPIGPAGQIKADEGYIAFAVSVCNERLKANWEKISRLCAALEADRKHKRSQGIITT